MSTVLAALGVVIGVALIWAGVRRFEWASPLKAVLSALDLLALTIAIVQLGWLGLGLVVGMNVLGFIGWGIAGWIYVDAELAAAGALGVADKESFASVYKALERDKRLTSLGPRRRARIVRVLAERARDPAETEAMAAPIGLLLIIGDITDLEWLVERFDSALRLYGRPATEAMAAADTITATTQRSAITMSEAIESLVVAGGGSISAPAGFAGGPAQPT